MALTNYFTMKRSKPTIKKIINLLCNAYIAVLFFPQTIFSNKLTYQNFTVYHHGNDNVQKEIKTVLDQAALRLEKSELYTNDFRQRIFLCKTQAEYSFFSGPSFKSLAINHPFTNNIFISKPSLKKDLMFKTRGIKTQRSINSVIAHETTHTLLNHKLGTMYARFKLPKWKN